MDMAIDQSRQHRRAGKIDDARALRYLNFVGRPNIRDAISFDKDRLVRKIRARLRVEQAARSDCHALRGRRLHVNERCIKGRGFGTAALCLNRARREDCCG
jgi:hypothetical protein